MLLKKTLEVAYIKYLKFTIPSPVTCSAFAWLHFNPVIHTCQAENQCLKLKHFKRVTVHIVKKLVKFYWNSRRPNIVAFFPLEHVQTLHATWKGNYVRTNSKAMRTWKCWNMLLFAPLDGSCY